LYNIIYKLIKERQCITETELFKEVSQDDTQFEIQCINKVVANLIYEGKMIWDTGDIVGTLSWRRLLH